MCFLSFWFLCFVWIWVLLKLLCYLVRVACRDLSFTCFHCVVRLFCFISLFKLVFLNFIPFLFFDHRCVQFFIFWSLLCPVFFFLFCKYFCFFCKNFCFVCKNFCFVCKNFCFVCSTAGLKSGQNVSKIAKNVSGGQFLPWKIRQKPPTVASFARFQKRFDRFLCLLLQIIFLQKNCFAKKIAKIAEQKHNGKSRDSGTKIANLKNELIYT